MMRGYGFSPARRASRARSASAGLARELRCGAARGCCARWPVVRVERAWCAVRVAAWRPPGARPTATAARAVTRARGPPRSLCNRRNGHKGQRGPPQRRCRRRTKTPPARRRCPSRIKPPPPGAGAGGKDPKRRRLCAGGDGGGKGAGGGGAPPPPPPLSLPSTSQLHGSAYSGGSFGSMPFTHVPRGLHEAQ